MLTMTVIAMSLALALMSGGCVVSKGKYEAATADLESARAELEKNRMLKDAMERQNKALKNRNEKVSTDLEMMIAEVQRIKEGREDEQTIMADREKNLKEENNNLVEQVLSLQRQYETVVSQTRALKKTVTRYQKELKEARERKSVSSTAASRPTGSNQKVGTSAVVGAHSMSSSGSVQPVGVSPKNTLAPININTASTSDLVLFLGLTKEMAERVVANRHYRLKGELVAKNVVPKSTFGVIRERITAVQ